MKNSVVQRDPGKLWPRVEFIVSAQAFDPAEITAALGVQPSRAATKGERITPTHTAHISTWILSSPPASEQTLAAQLGLLLDVLEPKRDIVRRLADQYTVEIWCRFSPQTESGEPILDGVLLTRLARLGIPVSFDLYPR
jgi:hypothetical protein